MLIHNPSYGHAYPHDIPGTRCDPEDGPWPRPYRILQEDELWKEFARLAKPQSTTFDPTKPFWRADTVNFQPSPYTKTQDRYVVKQLDIHGHMWTFTGVFDGHLGDVTVEHVAHHLPIIVRDFLRDSLADLQNDARARNGTGPTQRHELPPETVSRLFSQSIVAFDNAIASDVLELFGGLEGLKNFSDVQIRKIINDQHTGGANWKKARLCMYGTTALVTLVDPDHKNMWVANVGDCQATLVTPEDESGYKWKIETLTVLHNGDNDAEIERVRGLHPNEPECVIERRVLGALAPFRCLGDVPFKQPAEFSRRILYNLFPGFHDVSPWEEFLIRNITPPYITAEPDVIHRRLDGCFDARSTDDPMLGHRRIPRFLILVSDGFSDLCGSQEMQTKTIQRWASGIVASYCSSSSSLFPRDKNLGAIRAPASQANLALSLLRHALGEDANSVSKVLTLDMESSWIDDTAIVVQTL